MVAGLEFIQRIHANVSLETVVDDFVTHAVSMKRWIGKHGQGAATGREFQLALFLDGMKFHTSLARQTLGINIDPRSAISDRITDEIRRKETLQQLSAAAVARKGQRRQVREALAAEFAEVHTVPITFTEAEIVELNAGRPLWDKLERTESGLLRHHCCYPLCPHFLRNLATGEDRQLDTRRGLFKHLEYDISVLGNYVPGFHLRATKVFGRCNQATFETFRDLVNKVAPVYKSPLALQWRVPEDAELREIWDRAKNNESLTDKIAPSQASRAASVAAETVYSPDIQAMLGMLLDAGSVDDQVVRAVQQGLLHFDPKEPPQSMIEKIWLCATGRRGPHKQCEVQWLEQTPPPMASIAQYIERLIALGKHTEAMKLRTFVWDALQEQPLRRPYRLHTPCNRAGFSNDEPSFWALGFDTEKQMMQVAPLFAAKAYHERVAQLRAVRRGRTLPETTVHSTS